MRRILTLCLLLLPVSAWAQSAAVIANAPIYVTAVETQTPLRVAQVGTTLQVVADQGEWLQVAFNDPLWGRRIGWIQKKNVNVTDPNLRPMDLSLRDTPTASPTDAQNDNVARHSTTAQTTATAGQPGYPRPDVASTPSQAREGFWFNAGLGSGSLGCDNCSVRENGLSGGLSLGTTLGDKWLLGVGTTGWAKQRDGETLSVGTLDTRFRFYPARSSGFFLTGGVGLGTISFRDESEFGVG